MLVDVPSIELREVANTDEVVALRAECDGCDPARPCDEHAHSAWLWTVTAGAFQLRDSRGVHVLDPTRAMLMPAGHAYVIRHPAGPDRCVSFRGSLIDRMAAGGPRVVEIGAAWSARIARELDRHARGVGDPLALAEHLATVDAIDHASAGSRADRDLVAAIEHVVRLHFASAMSLAELADAAGYSLFHACRVFRAETGRTIHGFRRELRLRHALARVLDGGEPLAQISEACGFASQSHLTNLFRARFGVTPAKARTRELRVSA
jgi:AraC-like DNA-binding protein